MHLGHVIEEWVSSPLPLERKVGAGIKPDEFDKCEGKQQRRISGIVVLSRDQTHLGLCWCFLMVSRPRITYLQQ